MVLEFDADRRPNLNIPSSGLSRSSGLPSVEKAKKYLLSEMWNELSNQIQPFFEKQSEIQTGNGFWKA